MLHGLHRRALLEMPLRRAGVQLGNPVALGVAQLCAKQLGEQVVVAVPAPLVVEGGHKQVRPLERFQHRLALLLPCHHIAERPAETFQDRGVQQKLLHRGVLPCEYLFGEVVEHKAVTAGESS